MRNSYQTKQKDQLWKMIQAKEKDFTIKDLYEEGNDIGLTTIYRFIEQLEREGKITKIIRENHTTYYQYLESCPEENHFYLKCEKCGVMIHVDCKYAEELSRHMKKKHQFQLDKDHLIMNGICENCTKEISL